MFSESLNVSDLTGGQEIDASQILSLVSDLAAVNPTHHLGLCLLFRQWSDPPPQILWF